MSESSADIAATAAERAEPLILALASGKGGVGKTMLTVACAYELSLGGPTLVIDLDFFNRGLSGLFRGRREVGLLARPRFLDPAGGPPAAPWSVVEIEHQLYHVAYPDLIPDELVRLENRTAEDLAGELRDFIQRATELCGARSVVLDCHGGPDHTSFAAALLADHTLIIAEPDRITLHGTLNFLRQLQRGADPARTDIRLVFNKIVPAFRTPFLRRFYDEHLRAAFGDRDVIGMFPLELPLTKAFEETPIISRSYPYSLLARKMRVLLLDLLGARAKDCLAPSAPILPRWVRKYRRRTLGRIPWFVDQNVILQIVTFFTLLFIVVSFADKRFVAEQRPAFYSAALMAVAARHPEMKLDAELFVKRLLHDVETELPSSDSFPPKGFYSSWEETIAFQRAAFTDGPALFGPNYQRVWDRPHDSTFVRAIDWPVAQRYFVRNVSGQIHSVLFPEKWKKNLAVLRSARWWNWTLHSIRLWWHDWYWHGLVFGVAWLATAFYLDCVRKIDTAFVRTLRTSYYGALLWLALAIVMWGLPVVYIVNGISIRSGSMIGNERELAGWFLLLPYLFVTGHQIYRCYRLYHDGIFDVLLRDPTWRGRWRSVWSLIRRNNVLGQELYLRSIFVLVLCAGLVLFYLVAFRGLQL